MKSATSPTPPSNGFKPLIPVTVNNIYISFSFFFTFFLSNRFFFLIHFYLIMHGPSCGQSCLQLMWLELPVPHVVTVACTSCGYSCLYLMWLQLPVPHHCQNLIMCPQDPESVIMHGRYTLLKAEQLTLHYRCNLILNQPRAI